MALSLGETIRRQLSAHRTQYGVPVTFREQTFYVRTEETSGANAGQMAVGRELLGVFLSATGPRLFLFDPQKFVPITDEEAPKEGEEIIFRNLRYLITNASNLDALSDESIGLPVYGLRRVAGV